MSMIGALCWPSMIAPEGAQLAKVRNLPKSWLFRADFQYWLTLVVDFADLEGRS